MELKKEIALMSIDLHAMKKLILSFVSSESFAKECDAIFAFQKKLETLFKPLVDATLWITLSEEPSYSLLLLRKRLHEKKRILFVCHADVAKGAQGATIREEHGKLFGPGVADMKGGIALLYQVLQNFETLSPESRFGIDIAIVPDEESGSTYSMKALLSIAKEASLCFVMEPAYEDGSFVSTRSGSLTLEIAIHGKARHAGRSSERDQHALYAAARLALFIEEEMSLTLYTNVGRLEGGKEANTTAESATMVANFRSDTPKERDAFLEKLSKKIEALSKETGCTFHQKVLSERPPKLAAKTLEELLQKTCLDLNIPFSLRHARGASDGNNISMMGIPTIDSMGPVGGALHSKEEYILLSSLEERCRLMLLLLTYLNEGAL